MALVPLVWVIPFALFAVWWERKVSAHMQDRLGPMRTGGWHGWSQTIADILKLIQKEDIIPTAADKKLFMLAPMWSSRDPMPRMRRFLAAYVGSEINIGLFYIISISSLVVVGLLMAGGRRTINGPLRGPAFRHSDYQHEVRGPPFLLCDGGGH
jgi:NADH-quinone oxidoreductase subunit H